MIKCDGKYQYDSRAGRSKLCGIGPRGASPGKDKISARARILCAHHPEAKHTQVGRSARKGAAEPHSLPQLSQRRSYAFAPQKDSKPLDMIKSYWVMFRI